MLWKWTKVKQDVFDAMKKVVAREVPLACPDFSEKFEMWTDASKCQPDATFVQEGELIVQHSGKWMPAQLNCTAAEWKPLDIAETLKEFCDISMGHNNAVCAIHMPKVLCARLMQWNCVQPCHPGKKHVCSTTHQDFTCPKTHETTTEAVCHTCPTHQKLMHRLHRSLHDLLWRQTQS